MKKTLVLLFALCCALVAVAQTATTSPDWKDVNYAGDNLESHRLDIYLPKTQQEKYKVIVVIYGSAWFGNNMKAVAYHEIGKPLTDAGFAVVCINHRSSTEARFPAQINDVKGAIRYLRAHASEYRLDTSFIGITGYSSGGHLSSLAGVTNGIRLRTVGGTTVNLEGTVGGNTDYASTVDAVVDWFGPVDMSRMERCETVKDEKSPEAVLMGGAPAELPELVTLVSPISYVSLACPRFLVFHGDADSTVPHCQSVFFAEELEKAGRLEAFVTVPGGEHGPVTFNADTFRQMTDFFVHEAERMSE